MAQLSATDPIGSALRPILRVLLSLLVAGILIVFLAIWGQVSGADVATAWHALSLRAYLVALAFHVLLYVLRAVRFWILIPPRQRPPLVSLLMVSSAHTMAATILPAKIGEATFIVYLRNTCGVSAAAGTASLVVSRLLDLATLTLGLSIATLVLGTAGAYPQLGWLTSVGWLLAGGSLFLFALSARGDWLVEIASSLLHRVGLDRLERGRRILARTERVAHALRQAGGERRLVAATLVSLPIWLCVFLFCATLARGLGLPESVTLAEATFGSSLAILTSLIPLSAFASFGTLEAGWVLGFGALGIDPTLATATALGMHIVQLINVVGLGLLGHVGMGFAARAHGRR